MWLRVVVSDDHHAGSATYYWPKAAGFVLHNTHSAPVRW